MLPQQCAVQMGRDVQEQLSFGSSVCGMKACAAECLESIVLPLAGAGLAVYRLGIQGSTNQWSSGPPRRCRRSSTSG